MYVCRCALLLNFLHFSNKIGPIFGQLFCNVSGNNILSELGGPKRWKVFGVTSHQLLEKFQISTNLYDSLQLCLQSHQQSQAKIKPNSLTVKLYFLISCCSISGLEAAIKPLFWLNIFIKFCWQDFFLRYNACKPEISNLQSVGVYHRELQGGKGE